MELMKIAVDDVYPDEKNPREDFGDIDEMAASFALNAANPGEPVNPIVVVRDGGIFRLVDGERRYRAMALLGTRSCHAVVCDGIDEANAMVAMLTTDDKRQLTDVERSRGVQQMLLLGVDPKTVDRASRREPGTASRVRRAMLAADDSAEDMTLDRLLAIEEFADDPDAVEVLKTCGEGDWRLKAQQLRNEKEDREKSAPFVEVLDAYGLQLSTIGRDWSVPWSDETYDDPSAMASDIAADVDAAKEGRWEWNKYSVRMVHSVPNDPGPETREDPEAAADRALAERYSAIIRSGNARRAQEYLKALAAPHIDALAVEAARYLFNLDDYDSDVAELAEAAGIGVPELTMCDWMRCAVLSAGADDTALQIDPFSGGRFTPKGRTHWVSDVAGKYVGIVDAWKLDGFPPTDDDLEVLEAARKVVAAFDEPDGEEDGE